MNKKNPVSLDEFITSKISDLKTCHNINMSDRVEAILRETLELVANQAIELAGNEADARIERSVARHSVRKQYESNGRNQAAKRIKSAISRLKINPTTTYKET